MNLGAQSHLEPASPTSAVITNLNWTTLKVQWRSVIIIILPNATGSIKFPHNHCRERSLNHPSQREGKFAPITSVLLLKEHLLLMLTGRAEFEGLKAV